MFIIYGKNLSWEELGLWFKRAINKTLYIHASLLNHDGGYEEESKSIFTSHYKIQKVHHVLCSEGNIHIRGGHQGDEVFNYENYKESSIIGFLGNVTIIYTEKGSEQEFKIEFSLESTL